MPVDPKKCCDTHSKEKEDDGKCCQLNEKDNAEQLTYEQSFIVKTISVKEKNE